MKIVSKLQDPNHTNVYMWNKNKRHQCDTGQKPSECQVSEWEISQNSTVRKLGIFYVLGKRGA